MCEKCEKDIVLDTCRILVIRLLEACQNDTLCNAVRSGLGMILSDAGVVDEDFTPLPSHPIYKELPDHMKQEEQPHD